MNYYNDNDTKACAWLEELIKDSLIPPGKVDCKSIEDINPDDLKEFTQCHFFAGIGGWPLALKLAGWDTARPIWSGSCPCQPFSVAGSGEGAGDERHLWPAFANLIAECRPPAIVGEQVASKLGRQWLAGVFADLEFLGYAVAGADLCAAGVSAPHIRQRLFWVADSDGRQREQRGRSQGDGLSGSSDNGSDSGLAHAESSRNRRADGATCKEERRPEREMHGESGGASEAGSWSSSIPIHCRDGKWRRVPERVADSMFAGQWGESRENHIEQSPVRVGNANTGRQPQREERDGQQERAGQAQRGANSVRSDRRSSGSGQLEIEPALFSLLSDGISAILGTVWAESLRETEKIVRSHAKTSSSSPEETLRAMWERVEASSLQGSSGGPGTFSSEEILLIALCQLARNTEPEKQPTTSDLFEIQERTVRAVWEKTDRLTAFARSPHQRGLEGSSTGEPENPLRGMSPETPQTSPEISERMQGVRGSEQEERLLFKALAEVQKTWRSALNQKDGQRKAIHYCQGWAEGLTGFPLSSGLPGRVGLLRGAGNAIVPQVAAEFIRAAMEQFPREDAEEGAAPGDGE